MKIKSFLFLITLVIQLGYSQDWIPQSSGTTNYLTRVRFLNATTGFAVGISGLILKTTDGGNNWVQKPSGTTVNLGSVSFSDDLHGTVVGSDGTILRTTDGGDTWFFQYFDTSNLYESHLQAVHFFDNNIGIASGCWGLTVRTTDGGDNWVRTILPHNLWFAGMHCPDNQTGYIIGANDPWWGGVYKTTNAGGSWFPVLTNFNKGLWGSYFFDADNGVVSGYEVILRTTNGGTSWIDVSIPEIAGYNIDGIHFADQNTGFAVGYKLNTYEGLILKSTDGGITWIPQTNVVTDILTDVYMVNTGLGWAVGGQYPPQTSVILKYDPEIINPALPVPILSYPHGGQTVYSLSPTMSWYLNVNNTGLTGYELQYATTFTNFDNVATKVVISSPDTYNTVLSNLQPGTTYYWRMRSKAPNRNFSPYSGIESFVTYGTPGGVIVPIASWPRYDAYVYSLTPELKWYLPSTPTLPLKYEVKYGTNADLSGGTVISDITDLQTVLPRLSGSTRYYWAVRSYNGSTYSDYSDIVSFRTQENLEAIVPIISWPRGGAMVYSDSPTLNWYLPANGPNLTYKVKYSTDPNNVAGVQYIDNITNLWTVLSGLLANTTYYWQVCSYDGTLYSEYCGIDSFVVSGSVGPEIPIASWPRDNAILYMNNTALNWYMPTNAQGITSYTIEWSTDIGFSSPVTITGLTTQQYYATGLVPGTTYYWRVKAHKGALVSDWSTVAVFRTEGGTTGVGTGPTPAAAGWPRGGATMYTNNPELNWYLTNSHVGVVSFLLKYSTHPNMSGATSLVFPATQFSTTLTGLTYGQTYYWTIQSYDGTTYSTFDPPESFVIYVPNTLKSTQILSIPVPVIPAYGNKVYQKSVEISWKENTMSPEHGYELEYAKDAEFTNSVKVNNIAKTSYMLKNLENNTTYYWRVRSESGSNYSEYSHRGSFTTDIVTGVKPVEKITTYRLEQNYPNPFNPGTMITYHVPKSSKVTIKIYDLRGTEITTLVDEIKESGTYNIQWNAIKYSSGVYYYELKSGDVRIVKKMILAK